MHKQIYSWMDRQMDRQMDGHIQMYGWTDRQIDWSLYRGSFMFNFDNSLMLAFSQFEKKNKKRFRIWHYIEENQKNFKFLKKKSCL